MASVLKEEITQRPRDRGVRCNPNEAIAEWGSNFIISDMSDDGSS
jgi:hypothetical protein